MKAIDDKECKHEGVAYRGFHEIGTSESNISMERFFVFLWTCDRCLAVIKKQVQWEWKK